MELSNLRQSLLENIADWLDSEYVVFEQNLNGLSDSEPREKSELHIRMADAAMAIYVATMTGKSKWLNAESHLKETRQNYVDIGMAGIPALTAVINPCLVRFEKGERTEDLYESIMSLS